MEIIFIFLGLLQGFLEWWPISSSSVLILVSRNTSFSISESFLLALALHLPSGLAALLLFKQRFLVIVKEVFKLNTSVFTRKYVCSLFLSFIIGFPLYILYGDLAREYSLIALAIIAFGLFSTTFVLLIKPAAGLREEISWIDWLITGLLQGLSVLPGFSRSGLTIGYLCIRGYKPIRAVEASILLAIPVLILAGLINTLYTNIGLLEYFIVSIIVFTTTLFSGKVLIYLSQRLRMYVFTIVLAILVLINIVLEIIV